MAVLTLVTAIASVTIVAPGAASAAPVPPRAAAATGPADTPSAPAPSATKTPTSTQTATPTASGAGAAARVACGGRLAFGRIVTCPSITGAEQQVYRFTTTRDNDQIFGVLTQGTGVGVDARVTTADGTFVCGISANAGSCQVGAAGTYTVTVATFYGTGTGNYTLSIESMRSPSRCADLPNSFFSFASPGVTATLPAGSAGQCYRFTQANGSLLFLVDPGGAGDVQGVILDAQYQPLCPVRYTTTCRLTQPGPYWLFVHEFSGVASTYNLRMPRVSQSAGCPVVRLAPFGDPGNAVGTGSVTPAQVVTCQKVRIPAAGPVGIRFQDDQQLDWEVYDAAGTSVCQKYANRRTCPVPAAGDYTIVIQNRSDFGNNVSYKLAVSMQSRDAGCARTTGTSWGPAALVVHQTSGVQTNCQPFKGNAGDRIVLYSAPTQYNSIAAWLADAGGNALCTTIPPDGQDGCVLPATGTYRVLSYLGTWDDQSPDKTYKLQVRRLNQPVGCPTLHVGTYNAAPAGALGGIRCRILAVGAVGKYVVSPVDTQNDQLYGEVYDTSGQKVCGTGFCDIPAAGNYTMVLGGSDPGSVYDNDFTYVVALLPAQPAGCPAVSDGADAVVPHQGDLALGQYDCLRLPTPADARIVGLRPATASGAAVTVWDSAGTFLCDAYGVWQTSCTLSGTAPFYAVINADPFSATPPGAYTLAFARVDGPPACPALPQTADGASVTTGPGRFTACFSVPADQHAAREAFTYTRTSGTGSAVVAVFDSTGLRYCGTYAPQATQTANCSLPDGPATVILFTDAVDATYQVTHHALTP